MYFFVVQVELWGVHSDGDSPGPTTDPVCHQTADLGHPHRASGGGGGSINLILLIQERPQI